MPRPGECMSDLEHDLEEELRRALRPLDPSAGFAERVTARLESRRRPRGLAARYRWLPAALAACLVLSLFAAFGWQAHRQREGLAARAQLMQALRVTSQKLDLAYRGVQGASGNVAAPGSNET
jgi:hypothetical protein